MKIISDEVKIERLFDEIQQNIADLQSEFGTASELSANSELPEYLRAILFCSSIQQGNIWKKNFLIRPEVSAFTGMKKNGKLL